MAKVHATNDDNNKKIVKNLEDLVIIGLNEDDDENPGNDNLDDLLSGGDDKKEADIEDLPDLSKDEEDASSDTKDKENEEESPTSSEDDKEDDKEATPKKDFETDADGLMATIQDLVKKGHSVTIKVNAENVDHFGLTIDNKDYSLEEARALLVPESKGNETMAELSKDELSTMMAMMKEMQTNINALRENQSKNITSTAPEVPEPVAVEDDSENATPAAPKILKENKDEVTLSASEYKKWLSYTMDLEFNNKQKEASSFLESIMSIDDDLMVNDTLKSLDHMEEAVAAAKDADITKDSEPVTQAVTENDGFSLFNAFKEGSRFGIGIVGEKILPYLNEIKEHQLSQLILVDEALAVKDNDTISNDTLVKLEKQLTDTRRAAMDYQKKLVQEALNTLTLMNVRDRVFSLIESLNSDSMITKEALHSLIQEASNVTVVDNDKGYDTSYPTYDIFSKGIVERMRKLNPTATSTDTVNISADNVTVKSNEITKNTLPFLAPEKYNQNITIKSAISNLMEALVDIDGKVDLKLCEQAYLYKKVKNPKNISDFAMPIAIMESDSKGNMQLVAHPKLIENVAHILKNESCMRAYDIDSKQKFYDLRESLMPYLKAMNMKAPWETDEVIFEDATKSAVKK